MRTCVPCAPPPPALGFFVRGPHDTKEKGNKKGGATYADMIAHALSRVEDGKGPFTQICDIIEAQFSDYLNWKLER